MGKEVYKKIFLEDLPRQKGYGGKRFDWANCIGLKVRVLYDDIDTFIEIVNHTSKTNLLTIRNEVYGDYDVLSGNFIKCKLGKYFNKYTNEFRVEIGQPIKDDRRDLIIIDRKTVKDKKGQNYKYYKYKCNNCGFECGEHYKSGEHKEELWIEESNLLNAKNGCSCCCMPNQITVEGINDIPTTAPWMVKYFQGGYEEAKKYVKACGVKIKPICPCCGDIKKKAMSISTIYNEKSIGCKTCGDGVSYPAKFMKSVLNQVGLEYQQEVKFSWCNYFNKYTNKNAYGLYDFVIEENKLIIEVDGEFHRKDNSISGQTKEESEYIDNIKDIMAKENGYTVIRISDEDDLRGSVLKSDLSKMLDLSKIDWVKCEEFALSNLVKEVCNYWNDKKCRETANDLAYKFNTSRKTIINYLKKGTKLGWCYYNPKEEQRKYIFKAVKSISKEVEIFKDGKSLGIFESCMELSRQSEDLFGIKLKSKSISAVCTGKLNHHKGFTFKYTNNNNKNNEEVA